MNNQYYQVFREPNVYIFGSFLENVEYLGDWPIPQGDEPAMWVSNDEHPDKGLLLLTARGLLMHCHQEFLFRAEADGEPLEICSPYKIRVRRARLLYRVENWNYVSGLRFSV
ncbi:MAG: hypothetical protein L6406_11160, partial [Desulfobacterales bacterium]|nr:hypothetical protein [Desulfobacterales bacterium]